MPLIWLLSEARLLSPGHHPDWYYQNARQEDLLVQQALEAQGLTCRRVDWADPNLDWSQPDLALFRTTWDYFDRFSEFDDWLNRVGGQTTFVNPLPLIRWNLDKHYLGNLARRGIPIPKTVYLERGTEVDLLAWLRESGWPELIIKPCVSGAARLTFRVNADNAPAVQAQLEPWLAQEAFMLQPFLPKVVEEGEVSIVVIDGEVTHAVRKVAKAGDFRVQDDFGGTVHPHTPTEAERNLAVAAVAACEPSPLYARVDMVRQQGDQWLLMELEMIEPELWFRREPAAAERLATCVRRIIPR